jgi:hypothetical protein
MSGGPEVGSWPPSPRPWRLGQSEYEVRLHPTHLRQDAEDKGFFLGARGDSGVQCGNAELAGGVEVERRVLHVGKDATEASGLCHQGQLDRSYELDAEDGSSLIARLLVTDGVWKDRSSTVFAEGCVSFVEMVRVKSSRPTFLDAA